MAAAISFDDLIPKTAKTPGNVSFDDLVPKKQRGGLLRNFAAGTMEAITGNLAAVSDPGAGDELGALGIQPKVPMGNPAQGQHALNVALGKAGLNPEDVPADTTPEQFARTGGTFAAAAAAPGSIPLRAARVVIPATTSEIGGRVAGTPGRIIGALAGGGLTEGGPAMLRTGTRVLNRGWSAAGGREFLDPNNVARDYVTRAVNRDGGVPTLRQRLADWQQSGASAPALIDVTGNNTRRLVRSAASGASGDAQNIAQDYTRGIEANVQDRAAGLAHELTPGDPQTADQFRAGLEAARSKTVKPLYDEAFASNENISSPTLNEIFQTPAGKRALASAQVKMANDRAPIGPIGEPQPVQPESAGGGGRPEANPKADFYSAIRKFGGIKTHTNADHLTPEGGDVRAALKDVRTSGVINNRTGLPPDVMHGLLEREGWFGRHGSTDLNDLYDALKQGKDFQHPEIAAASGVGEANARHLAETRSLADEMGIHYEPHWSAADIENAANGAENQAVRLGGQAPGYNLRTLDYTKRALDDRISLAMRAGKNDDVRILTGLKNDLVNELESADKSGLYGKARSAFAKATAPINAMDAGAAGVRTPSNQYKETLTELAARSPNSRVAAGVSYRDAILAGIENPTAGATGFLNRLANSNRQTSNLSQTFGPEAGARFQAGVGNEVSRVQNARFISPNTGSQTALRAEETGLIDAIPTTHLGVLTRAIGAIRNGLTLTANQRAAIVRYGVSEADIQAISRQMPRARADAVARQILVAGQLSNRRQ